MGEVLRFRTETCERNLSLHLDEVLAKLGIELLDNRGSLRCWTCGRRFYADGAESNGFWWQCPRRCNVNYALIPSDGAVAGWTPPVSGDLPCDRKADALAIWPVVFRQVRDGLQDTGSEAQHHLTTSNVMRRGDWNE
jgi:hypothetical protein